MLEGELTVLVGERTVTATAGAFVLVPRGTAHTFSKAGTASAKLLIIISPAGFEQFFEEIAGPSDLEKIMALAPKYHLEIVGPPSVRMPGASEALFDLWHDLFGEHLHLLQHHLLRHADPVELEHHVGDAELPAVCDQALGDRVGRAEQEAVFL